MRFSRWQAVLALQIAIIGLALIGVEVRRSGPGRCALDATEIEPVYRVRVHNRNGHSELFCCIRCAELWLARSEPPEAVFVTDETTGEEIPAHDAWFVRSLVITRLSTRNRIHAFKKRADAERHAINAKGRILNDEDRPFWSW
jgi:hypothetical protein